MRRQSMPEAKEAGTSVTGISTRIPAIAGGQNRQERKQANEWNELPLLEASWRTRPLLHEC